MTRTVRSNLVAAALLSPLVAPITYSVGLIAAKLSLSALEREHASLRDATELVVGAYLVGAPVTYAVTLLVALPVVLWLRHVGRFTLGPVLALGAVAGALTALALAPRLHGEMFSVPFPWWAGVAVGLVCASVFWKLATRGVRATGAPPRRPTLAQPPSV